MATIIDGRAYADEVKLRVSTALGRLAGLSDTGAGVATILVSDDYAAAVYQRRIDAHARELGMASKMVQMPADSTLGQVVGKIAELDVDPEISGILVLRPMPAHLSESRIFRALPILKDIEAQHPENAGLLALGSPGSCPRPRPPPSTCSTAT